MWPWGHVAFGYLLYSPTVRLLRRRAPEPAAVLALAFGTQLPDLVDKPLAWVFHVTPTGYSVAHSAFVALPVGIALTALAAWWGRTAVGAAFTLGWWSHLVGDILFALVLRNPYAFDRVLWPLVVLPEATRRPTLELIGYYLSNWIELLSATHGVLFPALYVGALSLAVMLWLVDRAPGLPHPGWFR